VDEFQNFSTDSFADILSQARKYRLNLIVANQFTTQLSEEIRDAVFGNVGSVIAFRVGTTDAEFLAKQFAPVFDLDDLQFLPNYNTAVRMMIGGVPVQPFSMAILPPLGNPNPQLADALKQLSAAKYGRPKAQVEEAIFKRLETKQLPRPANPFGDLPSGRPAFGSSSLPPGSFPPSSRPGLGAPSSAASAAPKPAASGSSFLDEWLAKRQAGGTTPAPLPPARPKNDSPQPPRSQKPVKEPEPQVIKPSQPRLQPDAKPKPAAVAAPKSKEGEFVINRDIASDQHQTQTVHIDKDGNLTYEG
jgi:hypothetical protein